MVMFDVHGPFKVPVYQGKAGRVIGAEEGREFFAERSHFSKRRGCYVFGIRGRGLTPWYVGKATKGFKQECFEPHKLEKYDRCLADCRKGTPVLWLLTQPPTKPNYKAMGKLEDFLIQAGVAANPKLLNVQGAGRPKWEIKGILRGGKGRPSKDAKSFRRLMKMQKE